MVEGHFDPDPGLDEVHLPLPKVTFTLGEEPRLLNPAKWGETLSEETVDSGLPARSQPPAAYSR